MKKYRILANVEWEVEGEGIFDAGEEAQKVIMDEKPDKVSWFVVLEAGG